jgi:radical SAM superfamily enzyme YgiQ (UPF0313 family)
VHRKVSNSVRKRSIQNIIKEIEYLHDKYHAKYFAFIDANFPSTESDGFKFVAQVKKSHLYKKVHFIFELRVGMVSEQLLIALKDIGLYLVLFGFESGDQSVLELNRKDILAGNRYHEDH